MPDRTAAPYRHHVTRLYVAILRRHVPRRKDVGKEQHLIVPQSLRDLDRADVCEWHTHILRLPAGESPKHMRVAEESRGALSVNLLRHGRIGVAVVAQRPHSLPAVKAPSATNG